MMLSFGLDATPMWKYARHSDQQSDLSCLAPANLLQFTGTEFDRRKGTYHKKRHNLKDIH